MEELQSALKLLKRGKTKDPFGIAAKALHLARNHFLGLLLELFNDVISFRKAPPDQWKATRLVVIFKKGDASLPKNYRPIALISIMYKLFSRMICARVQRDIIDRQSPDQAAYRAGFSTCDHLLTIVLLLERVTEWNCSFWLGLVDYEKAFDTVEHEPLWNVLRENDVEESYVHLLRLLYANQSGSVLAGKESRSFSLLRGVKQGDPISGLLFIAVMESIFKRLKARWHCLNGRRKGLPYGVVIDHVTDPLSNLRFADDVLLFATSQQDMAKMLRDLAILSATYGLKLHADKTIALTNACNPPKSLSCGDYLVKVAASTDKEIYLEESCALRAFMKLSCQTESLALGTHSSSTR